MTLKISRILHAGYVFECGESKIAFDPVFENPFSANCHAFPDVEFDFERIRKLDFDAVFISHYHDDHLSLESLNRLDRKTPIFIYCIFDEIVEMVRALGFNRVEKLDLGVAVSVGSFEIVPRRALDSDVDSIFQIEAAGFNVLNVVDAWIDPLMLELLFADGPWDLILWPFQTMREIEVLNPNGAAPAAQSLPVEWIEQLTRLKPRYVVPSSCQFRFEDWSWYNSAFFPVSYRDFTSEIEARVPECKVVRLGPSAAVTLHKSSIEPAESLPWVRPIGEQDVDYEYVPDFAPPATAEIAKHFPGLGEAQLERVLAFCRTGLPEKYRSLASIEDGFFDEPKIWRLSVYDEQGLARRFHYRIQGSSVSQVEAPGGALPAWSTEIPAYKLYCALERGESLTSLYLRIDANGTVEVNEDPLIRCLFEGAIGSYQAAQLKRIL